MLLNLAAHRKAILVRHDHVGNHHVRAILLELCNCRLRIAARNHVKILPSEGNLDYFAHGRAVIDEIHRGLARVLRFSGRGNQQGLAHCASSFAKSFTATFASSVAMPAALASEIPDVKSCVLSSYSRMASSIRSVAVRSTVRCGEEVPYTNLYTPAPPFTQLFKMWMTASSPNSAPHSACAISPASKKSSASVSPALICSAPVWCA